MKNYIYRTFVVDSEALDTMTIEGLRKVSKEMATLWVELDYGLDMIWATTFTVFEVD
jgi:hypothetical protein